VFNVTLTTSETTLYDSTLTPNKSYTYQAILSSKQDQIPSNKVTVTTLDTTSHNFTWQTFTFGDAGAGSSTLYDCAIVNDTLAYAVGEIYMNDSTGQADPLPYNLAKWNGTKWELKRITTEFRGSPVTVPLEGIYAFSSNDIWVVGSLPIHGDGKSWTMYDVRTSTDPNLSLSKVWGSNSNNLFFVGRNGSIAHYSNGAWQKIESGTSLNINDIYGAQNNKTNELEIVAVSSNILSGLNREVIQISSSQAKIIGKDGIKGTLSSIWFKPGIKYYAVGDGIYEKNKLSSSLWRNNPFDITTYYTYKIRGIDLNNITAVGGVGEILHFNGKTWKSYRNDAGLISGNYYSVAIKENLIVAVGYDSPRAAITIGRR
jgi:hypothetical protein